MSDSVKVVDGTDGFGPLLGNVTLSQAAVARRRRTGRRLAHQTRIHSVIITTSLMSPPFPFSRKQEDERQQLQSKTHKKIDTNVFIEAEYKTCIDGAGSLI